MNPEELERRLIDFAVKIISMTESIKRSYAGVHLSKQIIRSGTSPALNYGEARGAESRKDFVHKIKIVLKELRETYISLKILNKSNLIKNGSFQIDVIAKECNELISIFVATTKTIGTL